MDGELARLVLAAAAIYGGIRLDLAWMRQKLTSHENRLTKLEEKQNGNTQAQST